MLRYFIIVKRERNKTLHTKNTLERNKTFCVVYEFLKLRKVPHIMQDETLMQRVSGLFGQTLTKFRGQVFRNA